MPARYPKDVNAASFLEFPHWARYGRYPSEGARPHDGCSCLTGVHSVYGYLLKSRRPGQHKLNSGSPPAGWFPLPDAGRGYYRYPGVDWTLVVTGPWPNSISRVLVSLNFQLTVAISLDFTGARATAVGLRVAPSRLVSPARCCCGDTYNFDIHAWMPVCHDDALSLSDWQCVPRLRRAVTVEGD